MPTLDDLVLPVAKIRTIADLFNIEHYGAKHEFGYVEIPGQSIVGAGTILEEVADEIEKIFHAECKNWNDEREQLQKAIDGLKDMIAALGGCNINNFPLTNLPQ